MFRQLLSSIATFAYVYYWHGAYSHLVYWSIIQWFGVFAEAMARRIRKTDSIQHLEVLETIFFLKEYYKQQTSKQ